MRSINTGYRVAASSISLRYRAYVLWMHMGFPGIGFLSVE